MLLKLLWPLTMPSVMHTPAKAAQRGPGGVLIRPPLIHPLLGVFQPLHHLHIGRGHPATGHGLFAACNSCSAMVCWRWARRCWPSCANASASKSAKSRKQALNQASAGIK